MSSEAQVLLRRAGDEFEQWIPAGYRAEGSGAEDSGGEADGAEASGGKSSGGAAVTPRIAVFTTKFTTNESVTAGRGMYVAYLFAADMSTVTLTLNQGIA